LGGYDLTAAKDTAVVALSSAGGDPLLAHWNYGLGRVVAFTSAAGDFPASGVTGGDWATGWRAWPGFARFWNGAVRWSMSAPLNRQLQPTITLEPGADGANVAYLAVESLNTDNTFADLATVSAGVRAPSGAITTTLMAQTAPGRY